MSESGHRQLLSIERGSQARRIPGFRCQRERSIDLDISLIGAAPMVERDG
jgi:hypothetical protein